VTPPGLCLDGADPPSHLANVRDVGGLPLVGGGTTRPGVLLRGDAPYAGDGSPPGVTWPPRVVVDLRSARERQSAPYTWPAGIVEHHRELFDAGDLRAMPEASGLMAVYAEMMDAAGPAIAGLIDLIGPGPTLIHCTAGKDRTGVSVAALLLLAGVEPEAVVDDYGRTEAAMGAVIGRLEARGLLGLNRIEPEWVRAPVEAIGLLIDRVSTWPGGVRGWFVDHGASNEGIAAFVRALT